MTWADLNERQQKYMQAIYDQDQENERHERGAWSRGYRPRPAAQWRWMYYGIIPEIGSDSPLRRRLKAVQLVDPGTGSTFAALEKRKLIQCRYPYPDGQFLDVQITPAGRKLVRSATGAEREKALPAGTLREWHWKAMAVAWKARPQGVQSDAPGYGGIGWNTWLRLRDYKDGALIEEYSVSGEYLPHVGYTPQIHWLRLSASGEQFYRENWLRYRELYPDVDAPAPNPDTSNEEL